MKKAEVARRFCPTFRNAVFFMIGLTFAVVYTELRLMNRFSTEVEAIVEEKSEKTHIDPPAVVVRKPLVSGPSFVKQLVDRCDFDDVESQKLEEVLDGMVTTELERRKTEREEKTRKREEDAALKKIRDENLEYDRLSDLLQQRLWDLQHPPDCSKAKLIYFKFAPEWKVGMGASFDFIVAALTLSLSTGRTLVIQTKAENNWYLFSECPEKNYQCFFESIGPCENEHVTNQKRYTLRYARDSDRIIEYVPQKFSDCHFCQYTQLNNTLLIKDKWYDPKACPTCARSRFWIQSQLIKFFFKPTPQVLQIISEAQDRLKWPRDLQTIQLLDGSKVRVTSDQLLSLPKDRPPSLNEITPYRIAGVHVRRTDKVNGDKKEADAQSIQSYMKVVQPWNPNDVFFATDSVGATREILEIAPEFLPNGSHIMIDVDQERLELGSGHMANNGMTFNHTVEVLNTIKDVWLLKQTDVFVCTVSSFFARLVIKLRFADNRSYGETWFSLDKDPWGNWPFGFSYLQ